MDLLLLVERAELIDAVNDRCHLRARDAAVRIEVRQVADLGADEHTCFVKRRHVTVVHIGKGRCRIGRAIAQRLGRKARYIQAADAAIELGITVRLRGKAHRVGVQRITARPVLRDGRLHPMPRCQQQELEHLARARGTVGGKGAIVVAADDPLLTQLHHVVIKPVGSVDVAISSAGIAGGRPLCRRHYVAAHGAAFRNGSAVLGHKASKAVTELFHLGERLIGFTDLINGKICLVGYTAFLVDDKVGKLILCRTGIVIKENGSLLQSAIGKACLRLPAGVAPFAERLRHLKARSVNLAAGDLNESARSAHPAGTEVVAEADERIELSLRRADFVAVKKVVELFLVALDLAHQQEFCLFARNAIREIFLAALRTVADVPLAAGGILLRAEALFLFDLLNGHIPCAHQAAARHCCGHAQLHGKAQRQKHGQRLSVSYDLLHRVFSFAGIGRNCPLSVESAAIIA